MILEPRSGFEHKNPTAIKEWKSSPQFPCQNEHFVNTSRKLLKNRDDPGIDSWVQLRLNLDFSWANPASRSRLAGFKNPPYWA